MKKILIFIVLITLTLGVTIPANAAGQATLTFSPEEKSVDQGGSFNIDIVVNSNGESIDTVRAFISFPADLLEVENFSLGALFPNVSPGNIIDNNNGYISEGGFRKASQTSESGVFGTITFNAKKEGQAIIRAISGSRLINKGEEEVNLAGLGQAEVEIRAVEAIPEFLPEVSKIEIPAKEETSYLNVKSSSHLNQNKWYSDNRIVFNWDISGVPLKTVKSYFYEFNKEPDFDPALELEKSETEKIFENVEDGVWYFHFKTKFTDNSFSDAAHFRVMIDTEAPGPIVPIVDEQKIIFGETTYLRFGTTDQTSGIDYYEVGIDGQFSKQRSPYLLEDLEVGEHILTVRATDKAGSSVSGETKINVIAKPFWQRYGALVVVLIIFLAIIIYLLLKKLMPRKRRK